MKSIIIETKLCRFEENGLNTDMLLFKSKILPDRSMLVLNFPNEGKHLHLFDECQHIFSKIKDEQENVHKPTGISSLRPVYKECLKRYFPKRGRRFDFESNSLLTSEESNKL